MKRIRDYIQAAFEAQGLSKRKLAKASRISPSHLSDLFTGTRRWNEDSIEKLCEGLQIAIPELFSGAAEGAETELRDSKHQTSHEWLEWILTRGTAEQEAGIKSNLKAFVQAIYMDSGNAPEGFFQSKKAPEEDQK